MNVQRHCYRICVSFSYKYSGKRVTDYALSDWFIPTARLNGRRHSTCFQAPRGWYVGVRGGLGCCWGLTFRRSAATASPTLPPVTRFDRMAPFLWLERVAHCYHVQPNLHTPEWPACVISRSAGLGLCLDPCLYYWGICMIFFKVGSTEEAVIHVDWSTLSLANDMF